jgi:hypothetical protein
MARGFGERVNLPQATAGKMRQRYEKRAAPEGRPFRSKSKGLLRGGGDKSEKKRV